MADESSLSPNFLSKGVVEKDLGLIEGEGEGKC